MALRSDPLDVDEFERVLRIGLGRAVLHLQTHDTSPYRNVILEACRCNWQWDTEEPTRERYMLDIIGLTTESLTYRTAILDALRSISALAEGTIEFSPKEWDAWQLSALARQMALEGDATARQVLRDAVAQHPTIERIVDELLLLEGGEGAVYVAGLLGAKLESGGEDAIWNASHASYCFESHVEEADLKRALTAGAEDPNVAAFAAVVEAERAKPEPKRPNHVPRGLDYSGILGRMNDFPLPCYPGPHPWAIWGKYAGESDLRRAAEALLELPDHDPLLRRHVQIFARRPFPLDPGRLIDLSRSGENEFPGSFAEAGEKDVLAISAFQALENVRHPDVRALALEFLKTNGWPTRAIDLLVGNFEDGDLTTINASFLGAEDTYCRHHITMAIKQLYKSLRPIGIEEMLLLVYEHGPCGFCRFQAVEWLLEADALPHSVIEECRFDSNTDIRELVTANPE
jgi:hypothetical protein